MSSTIRNPILIGMPAAGKSTVGVLLAKQLGVSFVDTDILIQTGQGCLLQEIIAEHGVAGFRAVEENYLLRVPPDCGVVATGGSAVYSQKAMSYLRSLGPVIYLCIGLAALKERLGSLDERGVLRTPGQSIDGLYAERSPLYEKYADITVCTDDVTPDRVVGVLLDQLRLVSG
ncbi:shikimate kinase [Desulfosarcina widdelii]|uniref:Shikimate kinase n=1 Tax=Desulfosarcina widdelii TaxID=947919 RepID=A0A5K7Z1E3_9BACT|nr:shikimate kinase [Desulfosarcina widdelii]BBO75506.1 shikimate kinase [Desulfosarcina widdelii]